MIIEGDSPGMNPPWNGPQRRIGITGGIASGKTSVGKFLAEIHAIPLLDADQYAHDALAPGSVSAQKVIERYGDVISESNEGLPKSINRSTLGKIIFTDKRERAWLESLLHPQISQRFQVEIEKHQGDPLIVLMIPLLFEAKLEFLCTEIWLVDCQPNQQLERLIRRNQLTAEEANARIASQWSLKKKRRLADVVINNNRGKDEWREQVQKLL